jgi:transcriptional regulator with XRE-family HTH domain
MENFKKLRNINNLTVEQLAKKLEISERTIAAYEVGKFYPSFKVLIKTIDIFDFSLDYLIRNNESLYPRNLKLIKLATKLDIRTFSESKKNIKITIESLLIGKSALKSALQQDSVDIELSNDFHSNLKNIRNLRNMTQADLAEKLGITRTLLSQYELRIYPTVNKLAEFSRLLDISIHALATGEKLSFEFQDRDFGESILLADHFLSLEEHKMLIHLMEAVLKK